MYTAMRAFVDYSTLLVRAMHELQLYSVGEVSPFILGADSESFELITP